MFAGRAMGSPQRVPALVYAPDFAHKNLTQLKRLVRDKRSSLFLRIAVNEEKFYNIDTRAQCYKTFYVRNLRKFVIS